MQLLRLAIGAIYVTTFPLPLLNGRRREGPAAAEGFCQFVRDSVAAKGRLRLRLPPYLMANRQ